MMQNRDKTLAPPTLSTTLKAGFELTTRHPWLLALPVALDCLYWIGPRLGAASLLTPWLNQWQAQVLALGLVDASALTLLTDAAQSFNVITQIAVPFLGVPALMGGLTPPTTPVTPLVLPVTDWGAFLAAWAGCLLLGLLLGGVYFSLMAAVVAHGEVQREGFGRILLRNCLRHLSLAGLLFLILLAGYLPLAFFLTLLALISPGLVLVGVAVASGLLLWLIVSLAFSLPGLFLDRLSAPRALLNSVQFIRRSFSRAILLPALALLIGRTVGMLWRVAGAGSWLTLVSIVGQAFILTSLLNALFIFYREQTRLTAAPMPELTV